MSSSSSSTTTSVQSIPSKTLQPLSTQKKKVGKLMQFTVEHIATEYADHRALFQQATKYFKQNFPGFENEKDKLAVSLSKVKARNGCYVTMQKKDIPKKEVREKEVQDYASAYHQYQSTSVKIINFVDTLSRKIDRLRPPASSLELNKGHNVFTLEVETLNTREKQLMDKAETDYLIPAMGLRKEMNSLLSKYETQVKTLQETIWNEGQTVTPLSTPITYVQSLVKKSVWGDPIMAPSSTSSGTNSTSTLPVEEDQTTQIDNKHAKEEIEEEEGTTEEASDEETEKPPLLINKPDKTAKIQPVKKANEIR
jgi:hypothetical protein